tara:strand:+ start:522 stop:1016 length:495 start_codon:yes stop_codon:yes gene_type:complete
MKNIFYLIIIAFFVSCGGEDSDESTIEVSKTFLEKYDNSVWVLDMQIREENHYLFFYNQPNGTFFSYAEDVSRYGGSYECEIYASGSTSFEDEQYYTEITQNKNGCLKFSSESTGLTEILEICEGKWSDGAPAILVTATGNDYDMAVNGAYREVSGVTYSQICN